MLGAGEEIMCGMNLRNLELYSECKLPPESPYFNSKAFLFFSSGFPL